MELNQITGTIIDAAIEIHQALGPGLLEEVYKQCLRAELTYRKLGVRAEVPLPVYYKDVSIDLGYRIDLLVQEQVVVELKAVSELAPIHKAQLFTYMKLAEKPFGLLLNFNTRLMKQGIVRVRL
mgnify:FL=1